jgi:hypothetical protein
MSLGALSDRMGTLTEEKDRGFDNLVEFHYNSSAEGNELLAR